MPLHDVLQGSSRDQASREIDRRYRDGVEEGGGRMSGANASPTGRSHQDMTGTFTNVPKQVEEILQKCTTTSRRSFLKASGLFVVSLTAGPLIGTAAAQSAAAQAAGPYPDPDFRQLDSWIVIHENNTATFYVGKTDLGQGTGTAFRQMM